MNRAYELAKKLMAVSYEIMWNITKINLDDLESLINKLQALLTK